MTPGTVTFVFDTTNAALWGEEVARERGIAAEVVPAPPEAGAACDLALVTMATSAGTLAAAFEAEGVPARAWPSGHPAPMVRG